MEDSVEKPSSVKIASNIRAWLEQVCMDKMVNYEKSFIQTVCIIVPLIPCFGNIFFNWMQSYSRYENDLHARVIKSW